MQSLPQDYHMVHEEDLEYLPVARVAFSTPKYTFSITLDTARNSENNVNTSHKSVDTLCVTFLPYMGTILSLIYTELLLHVYLCNKSNDAIIMVIKNVLTLYTIALSLK